LFIDGKNKNNNFGGSRVINLLDSKEFSQPPSFTKGENMGIQWTTHKVSEIKKNSYMKAHCVNCMDYTHRGEIAQGMVDMDYQSGQWNFDVCYTTCWHDRRTKHNDSMRIYSHKYYWDKKKGLLNNRRAK
jgi:hypothetical protein